MLILHNLTYHHPNKALLFNDLDLTINRQRKTALVGNNGSGKSTLLRIIAGELQPTSGRVHVDTKPYYLPQVFGQFNDRSIANALGIDLKMAALRAILQGNVIDDNLALLEDDWTIEERSLEALHHWGLEHLDLTQPLGKLSGGQKTRVFLAGIRIHQPALVLMDEPSNHLDLAGRQLLYNFIETYNQALLVVSHDRRLLNLLDVVCELSRNGITTYGGNYSFYCEQKRIETEALSGDLRNKEKELRKARGIQREAVERQQKLDTRGRKKQEKAGMPTIVMNTMRNNAEKSTSKLKAVHSEKVEIISDELQALRNELPDLNKMKFGFEDSTLHNGKILATAKAINFRYGDTRPWKEPLSFELQSGERIALKGRNGSGKTTLIKLITGELEPASGSLERAAASSVYIDQDYSLIRNESTIYEQAQAYNNTALQEHEIKIRLNRFLFSKDDWNKPCGALSGGERMRLILCCLTIGNKAPDLIILDEPTNNLDIRNIGILTAAIKQYKGTLIVVSHDEQFLDELNINQIIELT